MGSKAASKKSKSGSKSDSSSRKSRSSSKSKDKGKKDRSKSKDGNKSDSSGKSSKKEKKEKKEKNAKEGGESSVGAGAGVNLSASTEFEAGMLFSKFDQTGSGLLDKTAFVQLFKEVEAKRLAAGVTTGGTTGGAGGPPPIPPSFMAGQLFEKYSSPVSGGADGERSMTVGGFERFVQERGVGSTLNGGGKGVSFAGDKPLPVGFTAGQLFERFGDKSSGQMRKADFEKMIMETKMGDMGIGGMGGVGGMGVGEAEKAFNAANLYSRYKLDQNAGHVVEVRRATTSVNYTHYNETTGVPLTAEAAAAHLSQLRHLILQRSDEIKEVSLAIQKETMADLDGVLDRLKAAESLKQAALQQQLNECSAELESVDRLVEKITAGSEAAASAKGLSSYRGRQGMGEGEESNLGMIGFIQIYPELSSAIERTVNRYVNTRVEEVSDDLPREMAERNEVVRKTDKYEQALAVKDQMLWAMLKDKENWDSLMDDEKEMNREYAGEMGEW
ncbi:hypothetical protein TrRE_jg9923 [Triparma retinervis]|uniref:EF-hand domain-containing protein n=1 Tax=Triparma retinervis TaxID=2557542 RepID=A0A9W7APK9_9STRA|nr:hypothetical protein TrRE_jg9923 [Triparma retinervis]